jgi:hypothetical protein
LNAEIERWSAIPAGLLIQRLEDVQAYEVQFGTGMLQVEVHLLENTANYVHVAISVDDGSFLGSIRPLSSSFIRQKEQAGSLS